MSNDAKRVPRHHAMVDFPQHQERIWVVPEEHYLKVEKERDQALAELAALRTLLVNPVSEAVRDVLAERRRQVADEGWTPEHDDEHGDGQMARAAGCYAQYAHEAHLRSRGFWPTFWPWHRAWWKPCAPRRMLVKAGALILAEIERLDRAAAASDSREG